MRFIYPAFLVLLQVLACTVCSYGQLQPPANSQPVTNPQLVTSPQPPTNLPVAAGQNSSNIQQPSGSEQSSVVDQALNFPSKFFSRVNKTTADLDKQLTEQTQKYLAKLAKKEAKLRKKMASKDSTAAANLGTNSLDYNALAAKLQNASAQTAKAPGAYVPYLDSLQTSLKFLQQNQQLLSKGAAGSAAYQAQITSALAQVNQLQAKINVTNQINQQIAQHQARIKAMISQATNLSGVQSLYQGYSKQAYYYSAQLKQYKSDLNDPDKMEKRALGVLNQLPSFQQFMKSNSQLASLFGSPSGGVLGGGTATALPGLQTRSSIQSMLQSQVAAGGPNATQIVQQNIQSAQSALTSWKNKISQAGGGSSDQAIPDFKPNGQHTKTFLKRLIYGGSMQTARSTYAFPTTTTISASLGYKLDDKNSVGVSAGYLIGWGQDIKHIRVSSNGASLEAWLQMKIKGSIYGTGGYGYNYQPVAPSLAIPGMNNWTKTGLIGLTKKYKVSNKVTGNIQLLYDVLAASQVPRTNPIVFRIGYTF